MMDDQDHTPIHDAVYGANMIALEIIKDHLASRGEELDPNFASPGDPTPLSGGGQLRSDLPPEEEDQPHMYAIL
jgi:hypothetical protein